MATGSEWRNRCPEYEPSGVISRLVSVASVSGQWAERLDPAHLALHPQDEEQTDEQLAAQLGLSEETLSDLRLVCGVDTLNCLEETNRDVIPEDTDLVTSGIRRKAIESREERLIYDRISRQELFDNEHEMHIVGRKPSKPEDTIQPGELILSVHVYFPIIAFKHKEVKPYLTMLVLGSQKLTDLRDAIKCVSDLQIGGEFSSTPDLAPEHVSKDLYKSAFFFFEDTFYNDMRYPECRNLSRTITEWAESHDRGYGNFKMAKMEDRTFNDMWIKIGCPYLYCHQGDCEHLIIITDIRLAHRDDCLDKTLYPCVIRKPWFRTRKCSVCKLYIVRWVTNNDSFAPDDPSYFCNVCFKMLHYDTDGNKMGEFLAYPYVDPGMFN
ncbi:snRNA-activating protein complex subunit 3 [Callorhinchus milii]|uniref:snRNA-activating protein complex subunit 3 n=1 Tax=Callorhinchus milii TaxID=7868 RepID=V9KGE9_CALMI|nr:snRNA-activating protein complex subunit 3 [Callorhinchus milii]|eukprot:gi/632949476/ref/XP_007890177.1/ PREDICTED: snRNA-activating protein complex subunit 3 [Callorhinchus milii]